MHGFKLLALTAMAIPAAAFAQVGPNPAVPNGSLSPSVGGSTDTMTAPQDAQIGGRASGNIVDRTIDTRTDSTTDTRTSPGAGADTTTSTTANTGVSSNGTEVGTETRTKTGTRGMEPSKRRR